MSLVVGTLLACGTVREDEFICENAVSHLQECCAGFSAPIDCSFNQGCEDTTFPELDSVQGDCILHESCDALRQTGVCDRAARLPFMGLQADSTSPPICTGSQEADGAAPEDAAQVPVIACTSAADCVQGTVCCLQNNRFGVNLACQVGPCASGIQACATSIECEPGRVCEALESLRTPERVHSGRCLRRQWSTTRRATPRRSPRTRPASRAGDDAASSEAGPTSSDASPADAQPE